MVLERVDENPRFRIEKGSSAFNVNQYLSDLELLWESRFVGCFDSSDITNPEFIEGAKRFFFESFKNPNVTMVFDGDRLVACGGWEFDGINRYDGLPVYEIRRRTVLDEYKGRGLSKLIYDEVLTDVTNEVKGESFYLSSVTRTERIAGPLRDRDFEELSIEQYYGDIFADDPEKIDVLHELQRRGGYIALIKKFGSEKT